MNSKNSTILGAVLLVGVVILSALGDAALAQKLLGLLVGSAALGGAALSHRGLWVPDEPKTFADIDTGPKGDGGDGGFARVDLLGILAGLAVVAFVLSACAGPLKVAAVRIESSNGGKGAVVRVVKPDGTEEATIEIEELSGPIKVPASVVCPK